MSRRNARERKAMKMTAREERERRHEERLGKSRVMAKQLQGAVPDGIQMVREGKRRGE